MVSPARRKFFSKFYDRYVQKIYRFIFLKVDSEEASQDLTAEVFLRFWKQLDSATEIENPRAYIYSVARHLVVDYYRGQKQEKIRIEIEEVQIEDQTADLEKQGLMLSQLDNVKNALAKLSEDYQNAIIWYYLDELTIIQVAELMNKTENATRVTIHRALNTLKGELEKQEKSLLGKEREQQEAESEQIPRQAELDKKTEESHQASRTIF